MFCTNVVGSESFEFRINYQTFGSGFGLGSGFGFGFGFGSKS